MLSSNFRFKGRGALKFLFGRGESTRLKSLSIKAVQNSRRKDSRVSVIVSKKVAKAAPIRNRIRRRVYEFIRLNWEHITPGYDIALSVYDAGFANIEYDRLSEELTQAFKAAKLWR